MLKKEAILKTIQDHREELKQLGVINIALTGSFATDDADPESDIDFIITFGENQENYNNLFAVYELLSELFQNKIDLVTPDGVSEYILPYMEKVAINERL
jgi:predicted nucleotidyltransferase